ncbi:hypothetical protein LissoIVSPER_00038, partial [Lissonota sp. PSUC_FEM 10030012]|nr:hypothetical protein [Lissonota sp. PSUC_FEM 10030012]
VKEEDRACRGASECGQNNPRWRKDTHMVTIFLTVEARLFSLAVRQVCIASHRVQEFFTTLHLARVLASCLCVCVFFLCVQVCRCEYVMLTAS